MRARPFAGLWTLVLVVGVSQAPAAEPLSGRIEEVTSRPDYKHARWGLLVVDAQNGEVIYERNPDQMFVPASTTKIYTCAAALALLGPDYKFETKVFRDGEIKDGVLKGNLILVASGDLTLGGRTNDQGKMEFTNHDHTYADSTSTNTTLTKTDPLAGLRDLVRQIKEAGIKSVEGKLTIDESLFDPSRSSGSGPDSVGPILVNDNVVDVIVEPTEVGQRAKLSFRPSGIIDVRNEVWTVEEGKRPSIAVTTGNPWAQGGMEPGRRVSRPNATLDQPVAYNATGHIPVNSKPLVRIVPFREPARFALTCLEKLLSEEGIKATGHFETPRDGETVTPFRSTNSVEVASFKSPPLSEATKVTLKVSHNLYASTLPLIVAAKNGKRTLREGMQFQGKFLRDLGLDTNAVSFAGGAGGMNADSTSPRATVQLLQLLAKQPWYPVLEDGFPVLGVDGTLADVVGNDSPAKGKVKAKTGTLTWHDAVNDRSLLRSKALAGTMTTAKGRKLVFAMFVNDVPLPKGVTSTREGKVLGKLCEIVYEHAP